MKIKIGKKDMGLMWWLNGFGFVTIQQIAKALGCSKKSAYWRMQRLTTHHYIRYTPLYHHEPGIYRLTEPGRKLIGDSLPILKNIPVNNYRHDLTVVDLSLALRSRYPGEFISERRIRRWHGIHPRDRNLQVPDGILHQGDHMIAVEVELSTKSKARREKIFNQYAQDFEYGAVWYFCRGDYLYQQLSAYTRQYDFLRVFHLDNLLCDDDVQT